MDLVRPGDSTDHGGKVISVVVTILTRASGGEVHGVTDADGMINLQQGVSMEGLRVRFPDSSNGDIAS